MHLRAEDAAHTYVGSTAHIRRGRRVYSTEGQDCTSLQVFEIETLAAGDSASKQLENEGFVLIQSGSGTVARGANIRVTTHEVATKDLLLLGAGEPFTLTAGDDGMEFFTVSFDAKADGSQLLAQGIGPAHGEGALPNRPAWAAEEFAIADDALDLTPAHIPGELMPPQEGDSCYRYPHDRPTSMLDHWDQNSTSPGERAADHSHDINEEFWFILEGEGHVEHGADGRGSPPATTFEVGPGSLIGHPKGLHHTLVAKTPIKWYCLCMNRYLSEALESQESAQAAPASRL